MKRFYMTLLLLMCSSASFALVFSYQTVSISGTTLSKPPRITLSNDRWDLGTVYTQERFTNWSFYTVITMQSLDTVAATRLVSLQFQSTNNNWHGISRMYLTSMPYIRGSAILLNGSITTINLGLTAPITGRSLGCDFQILDAPTTPGDMNETITITGVYAN